MRYVSLLFPFLLAACATTGNDTRVAIVTMSNGQEFAGASCTVTTYYTGWNVVTPAYVDIGRGNGDLRIVCNKTGYRTSELILPPIGQSGSNVGVGLGGGSGGVGVGLGFMLPVTSSGGRYPPRIVVNMNPQ